MFLLKLSKESAESCSGLQIEALFKLSDAAFACFYSSCIRKRCRAQSFVCTILESQYASDLVNAHGSLTSFGAALDRANLFFTVIFTAELLVVAFSSWLLPFISDLWCWLDMFVVGMSLASLFLTNEPTGIVRVMRALRVLRLFGRLKSLRKILTALAFAIVPVCQVFLILFILLCVGAHIPRERRSNVHNQ